VHDFEKEVFFLKKFNREFQFFRKFEENKEESFLKDKYP
jgi:hypothetical protein